MELTIRGKRRFLTFATLVSVQRRIRRKLAIRYLDPGNPVRFPRTVQIEATSKCNLRCPLCCHSREAGPGQHLSTDDLESILQRLPWRPSEVILSGIGEPFSHPHYFELVDLLDQRGIKCTIFTNGTLLGSRSISEAILSRTSIRDVTISCDGARKEIFDAQRLGADFDSWRPAVREFAARAREQRGDTLVLTVSTVLSRQNIREIDGIVRLVADLGIGFLTVLDAIPIDDTAAAWCPTEAEFAEFRKCTAGLRKLGKTIGVTVDFILRREAAALPPSSVRCMQPWDYIFVRVDGNVAPCCAVFGSDKEAFVGNILRDDFASIWRGDSAREFRRRSAAGTNELCRTCSLY